METSRPAAVAFMTAAIECTAVCLSCHAGSGRWKDVLAGGVGCVEIRCDRRRLPASNGWSSLRSHEAVSAEILLPAIALTILGAFGASFACMPFALVPISSTADLALSPLIKA